MAGLLTTASTLMCPHGGTVTGVPSSARRSPLGGSPLVLATDTFTIAGCAFYAWRARIRACSCSGSCRPSAARAGRSDADRGERRVVPRRRRGMQGTVIVQATQQQVTAL